MVEVLYLVAGVIIAAVAFYLGRREVRQVQKDFKVAQEARVSYALRNDSLKEELKEVETLLFQKTEELSKREAENKKILSQKKSSEVRTGQIAEQMAPFLGGFPYNPKKAIFLGNPLDFVVFEEDGVHFIEVKSGRSQLNSTQRKIRDHIKEGRVTFEIYRIKGE